MSLFKNKKKKQEESIPLSLSILPPSEKPFEKEDWDNIDEDLTDKEEEEEEEEETEKETTVEELEEESSVPAIPKGTQPQSKKIRIEETEKTEETIENLDAEAEKLKKEMDELNEKIAVRKEKERKIKEQEEVNQSFEQSDGEFERRAIVTFQNHEDRLRNLESALFRMRSLI